MGRGRTKEGGVREEHPKEEDGGNCRKWTSMCGGVSGESREGPGLSCCFSCSESAGAELGESWGQGRGGPGSGQRGTMAVWTGTEAGARRRGERKKGIREKWTVKWKVRR